MTKDKSLEKIFLTQKPVFDDQDIFLQKLERKLEAVEFKQYVEAHLRRYKYAMIAAFVLGLVSGGVSLTFILRMPIDEPLFTLDVASGFLLTLQQNSRITISIALMLFLSYAVIGIINSILDIKSFYELHPRQAVE